MTDKVRIPITGTIGGSGMGRAYCKLAHEFVREGHGSSESCLFRAGKMCGLATSELPCLFESPDDPLWELIEQSVELERSLVPS